MERIQDGRSLVGSVQVYGTSWIGVTIAAIGTTLVCAGLMRARRPVVVAGIALVSVLLLIALEAVVGGSSLLVPAILLGQLALGVIAGIAVPLERWRYLTVSGGTLLSLLVGQAVLFPHGEQQSEDLFTVAAATVLALVVWLPLVAGSGIGQARERRSVQS